MRVKEDSEKAGLKLSIQKTKIIVSSPITSCQIKGAKVEAVTYLIFLGSQITADSEIKRHLLLGRKAMINLRQHIKKQRYHFAGKCPYSQTYGFSSSHIWMSELEHKES